MKNHHVSSRIATRGRSTRASTNIRRRKRAKAQTELEGFAIDIMGEIGTLYEQSPLLRDGGSWQFIYMYFLGLIIGGGTSQIQKNIISERGLGMPREPKVKDN